MEVAHDCVVKCEAAVNALNANSGARPLKRRDVAGAVASPAIAPRPEVEEHGTFTRLVLAIRVKKQDGKRTLVSPDGDDLLARMPSDRQPGPRPELVRVIGLAFAWHKELLRTGASVETIARAYGMSDSRVHALLSLTQLSPAILRAVLDGTLEENTGLKELIRVAQQAVWGKQRPVRRGGL